VNAAYKNGYQRKQEPQPEVIHRHTALLAIRSDMRLCKTHALETLVFAAELGEEAENPVLCTSNQAQALALNLKAMARSVNSAQNVYYRPAA
jgi:hypothetical protein